jgi:hypothetical protein
MRGDKLPEAMMGPAGSAGRRPSLQRLGGRPPDAMRGGAALSMASFTLPRALDEEEKFLQEKFL